MYDVYMCPIKPKNKKAPQLYWVLFGAAKEIRTLTPVKAPPPQDGVSTNSTTAALGNDWQIY